MPTELNILLMPSWLSVIRCATNRSSATKLMDGIEHSLHRSGYQITSFVCLPLYRRHWM